MYLIYRATLNSKYRAQITKSLININFTIEIH